MKKSLLGSLLGYRVWRVGCRKTACEKKLAIMSSTACSVASPHTPHPTRHTLKQGISLITVLMFMLAATIASTIVFRLLGSENFASGARLKQSEAYQASESGLDATRAWLTNRAADVGALISAYDTSKAENNVQKAILLTGNPANETDFGVLGAIGGNQGQKFEVYLTGVDTRTSPYKLKFLSVGESRNDGSKVSQTAIFSVSGLYRVNKPTYSRTSNTEFEDAFYGGISGNTQAKWSSATINGDLKIGNETAIKGNVLVTGNVQGDAALKCEDPSKETDIYVMGNINSTRFEACENVYAGSIGGNKSSGNTWLIPGDLYVKNGTFDASGVPNATIGGDFVSGGTVTLTGGRDRFTVAGNAIFTDEISGQTGQLNFNGWDRTKTLTVSKIFWSVSKIAGTNNGCNAINLGANGVYVAESNLITTEAINGASCKKQDNVYFGTPQTPAPSTNANKPATDCELSILASPTLAKAESEKAGNQCTLYDLAKKIDPATGRVPDPLELPQDIKDKWMAEAQAILDTANARNISAGSSLPDACIYLYKTNGGDNNTYCSSELSNTCSAKVTNYMNACYAALTTAKTEAEKKAYSDKGYLFRGENCDTEPAKCQYYLPIKVGITGNTPPNGVDGNFIWIFPNPASTSNLELPTTSKASNVLIYMPVGFNGNLAMSDKSGYTESGVGWLGNYFIYSDGDIKSASGSAKIKGTIFLAGGKSIGNLPDTRLEFNKELFDNLIGAGIIGATDGNTYGDNNGGFGSSSPDSYYIPVASRLGVGLDSKEISREVAPTQALWNNLTPSILVMPRVVRIATNEFAGKTATEHGGKLSDFYTFMYLNGAVRGTDPTNPTCNPSVNFASASIGKGVYECTFTAQTPPVSNFYVLVSGENLPTVKITTDKTSLAKDPITGKYTDCATVSLVVPESNTQQWTVTLSKSSGDNWIITPKTGCTGANPYTCTLPQGTTTFNAFGVCPDNLLVDGTATEDQVAPGVVITIDACEGGCEAAYPPDNAVTITREMAPRIPIQRLPLVDFPADELRCPTLLIGGGSVAQVTCTNGVPNGVDKWWCKDDGNNVTWTANNSIAGCDVINGKSTGVLPKDEPLITAAPAAPIPKSNTFNTDLTWNHYPVSITGSSGVFNFIASTYSTELTEGGKANFACENGVCEKEVYHGATYIVTGTSTVYVVSSVTNATVTSNCNSADGTKQYIYEEGGEGAQSCQLSITPIGGAVVITLTTDGASQEISCSIPENLQTIPKGNTFSPTTIGATFGTTPGSCSDSQIKYYITGGGLNEPIDPTSGVVLNPSEDTEYTITASAPTCTPTITSKECGKVKAVNATLPDIVCDLGNATYTESDLPQVSVSVSRGTTVEGVPVLECQKVEVIGPGDTTFLEVNPVWEWNDITSLGSITPTQNIHIFSKTTNLDAASPGEYGEGKGPKKEVKARATCNGIEKTVICKNTFTVSGDAPNTATATCSWQPDNGGNVTVFVDAPLPLLPGPSNVSCSERSPIIISEWVIKDQNNFEITIPGTASPAYPGTGSFLDPSGVQKYYVKVSKCGALTPSNAGAEVYCGQLTVGAVPSIVSCEVTGANAKTITLNDPSNICSDDGTYATKNANYTNEVWTASKNSSDDAPVTFPLDQGLYSHFSVTAKCNGRSISSTCTGTVNAPPLCAQLTTANTVVEIANGCFNVNLVVDNSNKNSNGWYLLCATPKMFDNGTANASCTRSATYSGNAKNSSGNCDQGLSTNTKLSWKIMEGNATGIISTSGTTSASYTINGVTTGVNMSCKIKTGDENW